MNEEMKGLQRKLKQKKEHLEIINNINGEDMSYIDNQYEGLTRTQTIDYINEMINEYNEIIERLNNVNN